VATVAPANDQDFQKRAPRNLPRQGKKYRLAFSIQRYFNFGGLQRDLRRVVLACAELGHEVHVLTAKWEGPQPANLTIHHFRLHSRTNHGRSREFSEVVRSFLRHENFDCVIGFNKMPGLDVYWSGDPCLAERIQHRKLPFFGALPRYRTYLDLEAMVLGNRSDTEILVLSEAEQERIVRHYGTSASRVHLLPAGIDWRRFQATASEPLVRASIRKELGIAEDHLMMLMVGSSFKTKGVDRALRAVASLPPPIRRQSRLVVVGNGYAAPFRRIARRLDLADRVLFTGGRDDVPTFYRSADLLLHPARTETAGHVLLEAMLCGLPVLVTENCGYSTHVERAQAGLICPDPFRQSDLNRLLLQMIPVPARRVWKQNAITYCSAVDLYGMVEKAVQVIVSRAERNCRAA
jgi:UDP-glucose:(heptosyl)LPS alpha-1,3-glucosyltransferase